MNVNIPIQSYQNYTITMPALKKGEKSVTHILTEADLAFLNQAGRLSVVCVTANANHNFRGFTNEILNPGWQNAIDAAAAVDPALTDYSNNFINGFLYDNATNGFNVQILYDKKYQKNYFKVFMEQAAAGDFPIIKIYFQLTQYGGAIYE